MAHVVIRQDGGPESLQLIIDGVDMSQHVYDEGFGLVKVGEGMDAVWGVRMILAPDVLDVDLPVAVIEAVRGSEDADQ